MLNLLHDTANGTCSSLCISRAETTRRSFCLGLSMYREVEDVHRGGIVSMDIDPVEGRYLLSGSSNGEIAIHDLYNTSGSMKYTCKCVTHVKREGIGRNRRPSHAHRGSVETAQWYPLDTGMFTTSGMDCKLKIWDTNAMKPADSFTFNGYVYMHDTSSIAMQHSLLAVATRDAKVTMVDLKSGSATHTLQGHRKSVYTVKWSPSEEFLLATGSADSCVRLWDIRSAKGSLMVLDQHNGDTAASTESMNTAHDGIVNGMCFTHDGLFLLTFGTDERIRLWNTSTGKNTLVNYGRIDNDHEKCIKIAVSHSMDPSLVYVPDRAQVALLDMFTGRNYIQLHGHYNQVTCIVVHPHTFDVYSGALDRSIQIWTADRDRNETVLKNYEDEKRDSFKNSGNQTQKTVTEDAWSSDED